MEIRFLGGVNEVGSLSMFMEDGGSRLLFDYGITPSMPPKYPLEAPPVDMVFLSHAHVDHSGLIPAICGKYCTPVHATSPTIEIAQLLVRDSYKISNLEGLEQPFDLFDVETTMECFNPVKYGKTISTNQLDITFHSAGHIPGSMMCLVQGQKRLLFTGDINTIDTHLIKGAKPINCDILVLEATYSGREHKPRKQQEYDFLEKIREVIDRGGKVILPSFAVGRTQELMLILANQNYETWLDGMGIAVSKLFLKYPEFLRSYRRLQNAFSKINFVRNRGTRKRALKGDVIITTSGMLDGGPVLEYIWNLKDDEKSAILLTGYQVEGTNGRRLLDDGKIVIAGVEQDLKCEVGFYDFSAHSGQCELVEFIHGCDPEKIILFHSDDQDPLISELNEQYHFIKLDTNEVAYLW